MPERQLLERLAVKRGVLNALIIKGMVEFQPGAPGRLCSNVESCDSQPGQVPLVGSPAAPALSSNLPAVVSALSSNRLSPSLGASGRVSGCLCFIFESLRLGLCASGRV